MCQRGCNVRYWVILGTWCCRGATVWFDMERHLVRFVAALQTCVAVLDSPVVRVRHEAGASVDVANWGRFSVQLSSTGEYFLGSWAYANDTSLYLWSSRRHSSVIPSESACWAGAAQFEGTSRQAPRPLMMVCDSCHVLCRLFGRSMGRV